MADDAIAASALSPATPKRALVGLPKFRLDPERPPRFHGGHVIGPETLHLIWDV